MKRVQERSIPASQGAAGGSLPQLREPVKGEENGGWGGNTTFPTKRVSVHPHGLTSLRFGGDRGVVLRS